jgi:hypothetical protein
MTDTDQTSLVENACKDQIATLSLNRPQRPTPSWQRAGAPSGGCFEAIRSQVTVICGNGRAFSGGADVRQQQLRKRKVFEQHGGPLGWTANSAELTRSVNWKR